MEITEKKERTNMTSLQKRFIPAYVMQARLNDTVGQATPDAVQSGVSETSAEAKQIP